MHTDLVSWCNVISYSHINWARYDMLSRRKPGRISRNDKKRPILHIQPIQNCKPTRSERVRLWTGRFFHSALFFSTEEIQPWLQFFVDQYEWFVRVQVEKSGCEREDDEKKDDGGG